jgi:tRNA (cytidine/uridine-2'-O-)-methyltransferase
MIHIVLYRPEIPQNTGNIGRMCALTKSRLHLIHPLGFTITDKHLKRSGMDYWNVLDVIHHNDWESFKLSPLGPSRLWLFTTKSAKCYWDVQFKDSDGLVFGNEGAGAPAFIHDEIADNRLTIPQADPTLRSLNLSTAAGIACYEALRQIDTSKP